jgi:SAM-dependent methyltransferase
MSLAPSIARTRIAEHIEIDWLSGRTATTTCPNCGFVGAVEPFLHIDYRPPDAHHEYVLQICPACTARFVDNTATMDYSTAELIELGWKIYQVQLGAGLWPISAPLTQVQKPAGARVLEIGGAFGFGLDFCVRAKHWRGEGFDPSPLASFGSESLGLKIRQEYFGEENLGEGPWDVVIATEVIEHMHHPVEFFELMRRALAPDGLLVLTTPDAEWIRPDQDAGALMPLLSPGVHLVLQTATSFEHGLRQAGFSHVQVLRSGMTLVGYASGAPFALAEDAAAGRALYRTYLVDRAKLTDPLDDMRLGFAGRGIFEAANDGDFAAAERAWAALVPAVRERFRIDLTHLTPLPSAAFAASLSELAAIMPLGLGMILFARAMQLLAEKTPRAELAEMFRIARAAIDALQAALARRSLTDGLSASLAHTIDDELLLCDAEAGRDSCIAGFLARGNDLLGWRGFAALMSAGALGPARQLQAAMDLRAPAETLPVAARKDAFITLSNLELAKGGEPALVFGYAAALRALGAPADEPVLAAFTRLVNAQRFEEAADAVAAENIPLLAKRAGASETGVNARAALLILSLQTQDPLTIPAALPGAALTPAAENLLLCEAFIRLVNAARHDEAQRFRAEQNILARAATLEAGAANNVRISEIVLELAVGDPAETPARLRDVELPQARRDTLLLDAFIRLVTAKRYEEAAAFLLAENVPALAARTGGAVARNATLAQAMLDIFAGDPAAVPARFAAQDVEPERRDRILLAAFTRLVSVERFADALAFYAAQDVARLIVAVPGVAARDAGLARIHLDLAAGDPADVPKRLATLDLAPAERDALLLEAFMGLVNAERYDEATVYVAAHDVAGLTARVGGEVAENTWQARILLDLAAGDPAAVPGHLANLPGLAPRRRDTLILEAFMRLVNMERFQDAAGFFEAHAIPAAALRVGGDPARNVVRAQIALDLAAGDPLNVPARLTELALAPAEAEEILLDALASLVNAQRFEEARNFVTAHDLEAAAARAETPAGAVALALLEIAAGDPASVPRRLDHAAIPAARKAALRLGAFAALVNAGRYEAAEIVVPPTEFAAALRGVSPTDAINAELAAVTLNFQCARTEAALAVVEALSAPDLAGDLRLECFVRLVNEGKVAVARSVIADKRFEPALAAAPERLRHDALTACLFLEFQAGEAEGILLRLDAVRAGGLAETRVESLTCAAFVELVNRSEHKIARALLPALEPVFLKLRPPFSDADANTLFAAGMLYLQERDSWRRSTSILARLRDATMQATPPGQEPPPLFWPAMRAEVLGLQRQKRGEDSIALLKNVTTAYPGAPDDLLEQIPKKKR